MLWTLEIRHYGPVGDVSEASLYGNIMLLLTNCGVHTGKYLDRGFKVRTEQSEVRTKA